MYGVAWTEKDVARLLELHAAGATRQEACDDLGISYYRLGAKLTRLGITMRDSRHWSAWEVATLKEMAAKKNTADEISKVIHRTSLAISHQARKLGVALVAPQNTAVPPAQSNQTWSEEDDTSLRWCLENHYDVDQSAVYLERSPSAVRNRMSILGLKLKDFK